MTMALLLLAPHALAVTVDAGIGYRRTFDAMDGRPEGLRAFGRVGFDGPVGGHFAVELGAYGRRPGEEIGWLAETLVYLPYQGNNESTFRQPISCEAAAFSAYVEVSPWVRRHDAKRPTAWIYGVAGVDARVILEDYAYVNPRFAEGVPDAEPAVLSGDPETLLVIGPTVGMAFNVWFVDRIGVRTVFLTRGGREEEADYGNTLPDGTPEPLDTVITLSTAIALDVMVRF